MTDAGASTGRLADVRAVIEQDYRSRTPRSQAWFERSRASLCGGVTGNLRYFAPYPLYFASADAARIADIDGHDYVDTFLCNGPLLLGHRHPEVVDTIERYRGMGSLIVNPTLATTVAETLCEVVPCAERVRFLNSGTEAVIAAIRIARAHTGRTKIVKFTGHYHGMADEVLVGLDSAGGIASPGIPPAAVSDVVVLPYDEPEALRLLFAADHDVAAVILDPAMHHGGLWGSTTEFLRTARELTQEHGALLIFDEVITGFRLALGGAQEHYGVTPDLTTLAKALGAGEKIAAVVGRADVMGVVDPAMTSGDALTFQSGTANDATTPLAAAQAALRVYQSHSAAGGYELLAARAARLANGMEEVFGRHGLAYRVNQLGPMLQILPSAQSARANPASRIDRERVSLIVLAMLTENVVLGLPGAHRIYLSFAHGDTDVDHVLVALDRVLARYDLADGA